MKKSLFSQKDNLNYNHFQKTHGGHVSISIDNTTRFALIKELNGHNGYFIKLSDKQIDFFLQNKNVIVPVFCHYQNSTTTMNKVAMNNYYD